MDSPPSKLERRLSNSHKRRRDSFDFSSVKPVTWTAAEKKQLKSDKHKFAIASARRAAAALDKLFASMKTLGKIPEETMDKVEAELGPHKQVLQNLHPHSISQEPLNVSSKLESIMELMAEVKTDVAEIKSEIEEDFRITNLSQLIDPEGHSQNATRFVELKMADITTTDSAEAWLQHFLENAYVNRASIDTLMKKFARVSKGGDAWAAALKVRNETAADIVAVLP